MLAFRILFWQLYRHPVSMLVSESPSIRVPSMRCYTGSQSTVVFVRFCAYQQQTTESSVCSSCSYMLPLIVALLNLRASSIGACSITPKGSFSVCHMAVILEPCSVIWVGRIVYFKLVFCPNRSNRQWGCGILVCLEHRLSSAHLASSLVSTVLDSDWPQRYWALVTWMSHRISNTLVPNLWTETPHWSVLPSVRAWFVVAPTQNSFVLHSYFQMIISEFQSELSMRSSACPNIRHLNRI